MGIQQLSLLLFPESDFEAWKKLVGETKLTSYTDYLELLAGCEATYADRGIEVIRVAMSVERMLEELARGWENIPDDRAIVIGLLVRFALSASRTT